MPTLQHGFHFEESRSDYHKTWVLQEIPSYLEYSFLYLAFTNSKSESTQNLSPFIQKPVGKIFILISTAYFPHSPKSTSYFLIP
jgi:hypothetical protein